MTTSESPATSPPADPASRDAGDEATATPTPHSPTPPAWPIDQPPSIRTSATPAQVLEALAALSRRGNLPGFARLQEPGRDGLGDARFRVEVFGIQYDRELIGTARRDPAGAASDALTHITFTSRLLKRLPAIILTVFILATWPGAWLTHSMLITYFGWYPASTWITYAWYIPLMLLSIPVLLKQYRVSTAAAHAEMHDVITRIRTSVNGQME